jgi:nitrogen fixation NifU-like protein
MDRSALYEEVILDHNRSPRNWGELPGATHRAEGHNPLCGDQLTLWLALDGDVIREARFEGEGCAISKASASMMTQAVRGKTTAEAEALWGRFHDLVTGKTPAAGEDKALGSLRAFGGVARFPMRVKCATLAWHALREALGHRDA